MHICALYGSTASNAEICARHAYQTRSSMYCTSKFQSTDITECSEMLIYEMFLIENWMCSICVHVYTDGYFCNDYVLCGQYELENDFLFVLHLQCIVSGVMHQLRHYQVATTNDTRCIDNIQIEVCLYTFIPCWLSWDCFYLFFPVFSHCNKNT